MFYRVQAMNFQNLREQEYEMLIIMFNSKLKIITEGKGVIGVQCLLGSNCQYHSRKENATLLHKGASGHDIVMLLDTTAAGCV